MHELMLRAAHYLLLLVLALTLPLMRVTRWLAHCLDQQMNRVDAALLLARAGRTSRAASASTNKRAGR